MIYFCFILLSRNNGGAVLYITQNRICFGVSLRSISEHTRDFSLNYFDEFKFFVWKSTVFLMKKAKIFWAATLRLKICSRNFTQKYYKINLFCQKKQNFSAAKTPHSKVEVNVFVKTLQRWMTYLKKKKSKTLKLTNHIHCFLEQFYANTRLNFAQNLRTN